MAGQEDPHKPAEPGARPTEPLPSNWKPALRFLLFILGVTASIAVVAVIVDRAIYG